MTRWNTILARVDTFIDMNPDHEGVKSIVRMAQDSKQDVARFLSSLDIREVGKLRKLVSDAFPKHLRGSHMLVADTDDKGHWVVERKPASTDRMH